MRIGWTISVGRANDTSISLQTSYIAERHRRRGTLTPHLGVTDVTGVTELATTGGVHLLVAAPERLRLISLIAMPTMIVSVEGERPGLRQDERDSRRATAKQPGGQIAVKCVVSEHR